MLSDPLDASFAPASRASFLSQPTPSRQPTSEPNSDASSVGPASSDSDETSTEEEEEDEEVVLDAEDGDQLGTPRRPRMPAGPSATPLRSALKRGRMPGQGVGGGRINVKMLDGRSVSFSFLE